MGSVINVLHISDIHFGMESSDNPTGFAKREIALEEMVKLLQNLNNDDKPDIVVISGDIVWQAREEGFKIAQKWIENLLSVLELTPQDLVLCAGNHEINRQKTIGLTRPGNSSEADKFLSIENLENFLRPFESYENFYSEMNIPKLTLGNGEYSLFGQREVKGLKFIVLNSAWFCRNDQDKLKLWIGLPQLQILQSKNQIIHPKEFNNGIISVAVLHHPISWLHEEEQQTYDPRPGSYRYLAERSHLILSGHVHASIENASRMFNRAYVVTGGSTYSGRDYRNNFSILKINKEERACIQIPYEYEPRNDNWERKQEQKLFLTIEEEKKNEFLGGQPPQSLLWNIPYQKHPNFVGRDELLLTIEKNLIEYPEQILTGLGGVGKTQLAVEYSFKNKEKYNIIWWIRAKNETTILSDFKELCKELGLPVKNQKGEHILTSVLKKWMQTNDKWLLIFDNIEDLDLYKKYISTNPKGHIIVTTRRQDSVNSLLIDILKPEDSSLFLLRSTSQNDKNKAELLADELGYLPLALEQASAYIRQTGLTIDEYYNRFLSHKAEIIGRGKALNNEDTILTIWDLSLSEVSKKLDLCREFMNFCSFLSPFNITQEIFVDENERFYPRFLSDKIQSILDMDDILSLLMNYSLIQSRNGIFSIHPLLQTVIISRLSHDDKINYIVCVLDVLNKCSTQVAKRRGLNVIISHLFNIIEHTENENIINENVISILNKLSKILFEFGHYKLTLQLGEKKINYCKSLYGENDEKTAKSYHDFAVSLTSTGDLNEAKKLTEKSLENKGISIDSRINYLNTLSNIELKIGQKEVALKIINEAECLYHKNTADIECDDSLELILNTQGKIYRETCEYQKAEEKLLKAIELMEHRKDFLNMAHGYSDLGTLFFEKGDYIKAEYYHKKAIDLDVKIFGSNHPYVARDYSNLGLVFFNNFNKILAKKYFRKSLAINLEFFSEIPSVELATAYNNLGLVYEIEGKYDESISYFQKTIDLYNHLNCLGYPSLSQAYYNLGSSYFNKGDTSLAEKNINEALKNDLSLYGEKHIEVAKDYGKLGAIYIDSNNLLHGEKYSLKALEIYNNLLLENSDSAWVNFNLSILYLKNNRIPRSKRCIENALKTIEKAYGNEHQLMMVMFCSYNKFVLENSFFDKLGTFVEELYKRFLKKI